MPGAKGNGGNPGTPPALGTAVASPVPVPPGTAVALGAVTGMSGARFE